MGPTTIPPNGENNELFFSFIIFSRKRVNNTIIKVVCKVTLETTYNKNKIKWFFSVFFVKIIWFFVCICDQLKTLGSGKFWSKCNDSSVVMGNENYFIWLIICSSRNGEDWKGWRIWTPTPNNSSCFFLWFSIENIKELRRTYVRLACLSCSCQ